MTFTEYQDKAAKTAVYPRQNSPQGLEYAVLGLCGEAGSVANQTKKIFRDDKGEVTLQRRADILRQLGDTLWYIAQSCTELDFNLDDLAWDNIRKLSGRIEKGTLHGDGDSR